MTAETGHIPYRDSKLTRILQNSLGGNARTGIVCTITPSALHVEESLSTLKFASRAKAVKNHAKVNEVFDEKALIVKLQKQVRQLEREKMDLQSGSALRRLEEEKQELAVILAEKQEHMDRLNRLLQKQTMTAMRSPRLCKPAKRPDRRKTWAPGAASRSRMSLALSEQAGALSLRSLAPGDGRRSLLPGVEPMEDLEPCVLGDEGKRQLACLGHASPPLAIMMGLEPCCCFSYGESVAPSCAGRCARRTPCQPFWRSGHPSRQERQAGTNGH